MTMKVSEKTLKRLAIEQAEEVERVRLLNRRKHKKIRKLKNFYKEQAQLKAMKTRQSMRSNSWSQGCA